jgi:hypothetical protein
MSACSLPTLLTSLHEDIEHQLGRARKTIQHPGIKGATAESVWLKLLKKYLPMRYQADRAHVIDSENTCSDQIDIVIFDRQYSPFIFNYEDSLVIPAECVYAVFEVKQTLDKDNIEYAQEKIASVRRLYRTSKPVVHLQGRDTKKIYDILGGVLSLGSEWKPFDGAPLKKALAASTHLNRLDLGCAAEAGIFGYNAVTGQYDIKPGGKPGTAFLFELIYRLQQLGTAPMLDIHAYGKWMNVAP